MLISVRGENHIGREIGREVRTDPRDEVVKTHLGEIEEVAKFGKRESVFRCCGFEFNSLAPVVQHFLNQLIEYPVGAPRIGGEIIEKGANVCAGEIESAIAKIEKGLTAKLAAALDRRGPWRENFLLPLEDSRKQNHLEAGAQDLQQRLEEVFGNPTNIFLASKIAPQIFKEAIKTLPRGQSENDLLREREETVGRDRKKRIQKIEEARSFLKKL